MLTAENFAARLAQANIASKSDIANFIKKTNFDDKLKNVNMKITSNKTKHILVKSAFKNYKHLTKVLLLVKFTLIMIDHKITLYFNQFTKLLQHFLVFPDITSEWESKELPNEKFTPPFTLNKRLSPKLVGVNNPRTRLEFKGSCLKQDKAPFIPNNAVNLYTVYELNIWTYITRPKC